MSSPRIRKAEPADLGAIGSLIVAQCREPTSHCIHSWSGESVEETVEGFVTMQDKDELAFVLAESEDGPIAALGCEFDRELRRGWLFGPHAAADWEPLADQLYGAVREALPSDIHRLTSYVNVRNERARAFYRGRGFEEDPVHHHEFWLSWDEGRADPARGQRLDEAARASFFALFDEAFPKAYYSHERLLEMQGDSHEIFVASSGGCVDGFCVASRSAGGQSGEIQFLAVREERRRRGLGRSLLEDGLAWLEREGVTGVLLNVADDRGGARTLYEQVGFELRHSGVALHLRPCD